MEHRRYPGKRPGFVSTWNMEAQSDMLDDPSHLRRVIEECRAQIAHLDHSNSCLRLKVSDLQKKVKTPPLTDQRSDPEVWDLKERLRRLEEENQTLREKNNELEKSKLALERQQDQRQGGSRLTLEETLPELKIEKKIFSEKEKDFPELRQFGERKQKDMEKLQAATTDLEEKRKELEMMWQKLNKEKAEMEEQKIQMTSQEKKLQKEKQQVQDKLKILAGLSEFEETIRREKLQMLEIRSDFEKERQELEELRQSVKKETSLMDQSRVKVEVKEKNGLDREKREIQEDRVAEQDRRPFFPKNIKDRKTEEKRVREEKYEGKKRRDRRTRW